VLSAQRRRSVDITPPRTGKNCEQGEGTRRAAERGKEAKKLLWQLEQKVPTEEEKNYFLSVESAVQKIEKSEPLSESHRKWSNRRLERIHRRQKRELLHNTAVRGYVNTNVGERLAAPLRQKDKTPTPPKRMRCELFYVGSLTKKGTA
jgi:hypothetical protein